MSMNLQTKGKMRNKKPALGRGLGSLLGENGDLNPVSPRNLQEEAPDRSPMQKAGGEGKPNTVAEKDRIWQIAIDKLAANENQPRRVFEREPLQSLANSIQEKGILQPIVARRLSQDKFEIIAGERRWRAAQLAGLHEVPVILKNVNDQNTLELALIENIQREDLNSIEEAEAYRFLSEKYHLTQEELGQRVGKDRASIANTMRLLNLSPFVQKMVSDSRLSKAMRNFLLLLLTRIYS